MITPEQIERVARAACEEMGLDPDERINGFVPRLNCSFHGYAWEAYAGDAKTAIAIDRAIRKLEGKG